MKLVHLLGLIIDKTVIQLGIRISGQNRNKQKYAKINKTNVL